MVNQGSRFIYINPVIISLDNNPIECTCQNYNLIRYIQSKFSCSIPIIPEPELRIDINTICYGPPLLRGVPLYKILGEDLLCLMDFSYYFTGSPRNCSYFQHMHPYNTSIVVDCSYKGFFNAPEFNLPFGYRLIEVHLEGNNLIEGPSKELAEYKDVIKLNLSGNQIEKMLWVPPNIKVGEKNLAGFM